MIGYGIVIENSASDIPKNFKYKIRSTFPFWNNAMKFPQFIPPGPTDEAGKSLIYLNRLVHCYQNGKDY